MSTRRNTRLSAAVRAASSHPGRFLRGAVKLPLIQTASARIEALPVVELAELAGDAEEVVVRLPRSDTRHRWSLGAAEQLTIQVLVRVRHCKTAFEIGTFNGGTTRLLAESLPDEGRVWTLDLSPAAFDVTQAPEGFSGIEVGVAYRASPAAYKITQLHGDSLAFDFTPFESSADLVLVDGGHEYENGLADTVAALRVVRQRGIVLWDDFEPYWDGLVNGICDAMRGRSLCRLAGTSLGVYVAP